MADFRKGTNGPFELLVRVRGRHLNANARLPLRHHGVAEPDHVDSFLEQAVGVRTTFQYSI